MKTTCAKFQRRLRSRGRVAMLAIFSLGLICLWAPAGFAQTPGQAEIEKIVAAHGEWVKALGNPEMLDAMGMGSGFIAESMAHDPRRARLSGWDLSGLNLEEANLRAAELRGARMEGIELSGANLSHAQLQEANLSEANLDRADLRYANLSKANLAGVNLAGANLRNAFLDGADLRGATLTGADLREAHLAGANLRGANLGDADLSGAELNQASLLSADLQGARLSGAQLIDTDLRGAGLKMTDLTGALLTGANLNDAFLYDTVLANVTLTGASLEGINLFANNLEGTKLDGVSLFGVVFDPPPNRWKELADKVHTIARARNLGMMTFYNNSLPLESLRRLFKQNGYHSQELAITYAIRRGKRKRITENGTLTERLGSLLQFVFIEFPIEYGASPYRPFALLFALVMGLGFVYMIPLIRPSERFGEIWMITPKGQFFRREEGVDEKIFRAKTPRDLLLAFWFSFLSAFNIGGQALNLDDIFMQCQRKEYHLRGTMWVRTIAGIQSLVCMYLIVLTLLVYLEKITF